MSFVSQRERPYPAQYAKRRVNSMFRKQEYTEVTRRQKCLHATGASCLIVSVDNFPHKHTAKLEKQTCKRLLKGAFTLTDNNNGRSGVVSAHS